MRPAIVSGIVTRDAPVSYWLYFLCPQQQSQKSLQKLTRPWGPFLERPGNFSGPKANFKIKTF